GLPPDAPALKYRGLRDRLDECIRTKGAQPRRYGLAPVSRRFGFTGGIYERASARKDFHARGDHRAFGRRDGLRELTIDEADGGENTWRRGSGGARLRLRRSSRRRPSSSRR